VVSIVVGMLFSGSVKLAALGKEAETTLEGTGADKREYLILTLSAAVVVVDIRLRLFCCSPRFVVVLLVSAVGVKVS